MCKPSYEDLEFLLKKEKQKTARLEKKLVSERIKGRSEGRDTAESTYAAVREHAREIGYLMDMSRDDD